MKTKIIILASTIVMACYMSSGFAQALGDSAKPDMGMSVNPNVKDLPEAARNALNAAGVTDVAGMIVIDKQGQIHLLKSAEVEHRENVTFPIPTTEIRSIVLMTIVEYEGLTCVTIIIGGDSQTICS